MESGTTIRELLDFYGEKAGWRPPPRSLSLTHWIWVRYRWLSLSTQKDPRWFNVRSEHSKAPTDLPQAVRLSPSVKWYAVISMQRTACYLYYLHYSPLFSPLFCIHQHWGVLGQAVGLEPGHVLDWCKIASIFIKLHLIIHFWKNCPYLDSLTRYIDMLFLKHWHIRSIMRRLDRRIDDKSIWMYLKSYSMAWLPATTRARQVANGHSLKWQGC